MAGRATPGSACIRQATLTREWSEGSEMDGEADAEAARR
jgi:hypothetical protein